MTQNNAYLQLSIGSIFTADKGPFLMTSLLWLVQPPPLVFCRLLCFAGVHFIVDISYCCHTCKAHTELSQATRRFCTEMIVCMDIDRIHEYSQMHNTLRRLHCSSDRELNCRGSPMAKHLETYWKTWFDNTIGPAKKGNLHARTHTHTHNRFTALRILSLAQPGWASTRRNIQPLILIVVINHPYLLSPPTMIHGILPIQSMCFTVFFP